MIKRRKTRTVSIGSVRIGSGHPVAIQSMAKAKTSDVRAVVSQIKQLQGCGCEIVRVAVKDAADAGAIAAIRKQVRLPLVADYCGALVNVSIKAVDRASGRVELYAPVFPGLDYRIAAPVDDYVASFHQALPGQTPEIAFSCNCILNYLHSGLEGKRTGDLVGPFTFGEIGYQLLNQTLVYLTVR